VNIAPELAMRLGWAVSGQGMIARAVFEASSAGLISSRIALVIFDRTGPTASMMDYCRRNSIDFRVIEPDRLEQSMIALRDQYGLDWLGLTFNRILSPLVISAFEGQIFNVHFSLLPAFPGFGATRKALQSGLPHAGVTVHLIDAGIDTGPVIAQVKVDILTDDTEQSLGRRQFEAAVPLAIQTVRNAERNRTLDFDRADEDIELFSRSFCAGLG
jgi:phosphoribosylglycinamide formyltransferase-1